MSDLVGNTESRFSRVAAHKVVAPNSISNVSFQIPIVDCFTFKTFQELPLHYPNWYLLN